MLIDLSVNVTKLGNKNALNNERMVSFGHLGTHFDVMNKEFPLEYVKRKAIVFNVKNIFKRDIEAADINIDLIEKDSFVAFYTGFIEKYEYGSKDYFASHPQLSNELIDELIKKEVSIIGIDFAGVRCGIEHTPKDQYCADRGIFIVENLCNLGKILENNQNMEFIANTYPINFSDMTGLPCRVVGEILLNSQ